MLNPKILSRIKNFVIGCFTVDIVVVCGKQDVYVPYNQFNDWFRKTHKKIVPVQIDGLPLEESVAKEKIQEATENKATIKGQIMVSIQTRDGLQIRKKNLSYLELKQLVEKLEGLC